MLFNKEFHLGGLLLKWKHPKKLIRERLGGFLPYHFVCGGILSVIALSFILNQKYDALASFTLVGVIMWVFNNITPSYELRDEGILYESGTERIYFKWAAIQSYSVLQLDENNPALITFKLQNHNFWQKDCPAFFYDPKKLDKSLILSILQEKLPDKLDFDFDEVVASERNLQA